MKIYSPIVEHMKLQIRMNTRTRQVEIRVRKWSFVLFYCSPLLQTSEHTQDIGSLQKAADFVKAFILGFAIDVRLSPPRVVLIMSRVSLFCFVLCC